MKNRIVLAALLAAAITWACGGETVSGPTTSEAPAPVAAAPAPAPTPTPEPKPVDGEPTGNGRECSLSGATLTLKNTSGVAQSYVGWSTDFDQATTNGPEGPLVRKHGDTYDYTDPVGKCRQLDIAHDYNGTALCHAFLDKDGKPFKANGSPENVAKINECRAKPCVPTWRELEAEYGEWEDAPSTQTTKCWKQQRRRRIVREQNSCTLETRIKSETWEQRQVEVPCPQPTPTPTPSPTCENTAAFFKGNHNFGLFNLANSSEASETAHVNSIVGIGPWESFDTEGAKNDDCTGADVSAKVVIVKAGSEQSATWEYKTYLNVTQGQQLCSYDPPGPGGGKDISHVRYFRCD